MNDLPILIRPAMYLLRSLVPDAERQEVLSELSDEYREKARALGRGAAGWWIWRQALSSVPTLVGRAWWRGWTGFEPRANRSRPGGTMFESWSKDVRFALRRLRRRPSYTFLTVATLAIGVAGTAAVFGIARGLLLEPLPYESEEDVSVFWARLSWSEAEFLHIRPEVDQFESLAAYRPADVTLRQGDAPAQLIPGISSSAELFAVLGASPAIGTAFRLGDDAMGSEPVAVLSHSLWSELGGDPAMVGTRLELSGVSRVVVGVMPEGFWFPDPTVDVWLSEELNPQNEAGNYTLIGRAAPGTPAAALTTQIERITAMLGERFTYPAEWDMTVGAEITPVREFLVGGVRPSLLAMLAAMAVILLIACVNVATLMMGQVDARGPELVVRTALGAGRARLLRQLVVESLVIGAFSGAAGALLAVTGFRFLLGALPLGALGETAAVDWTLFLTAMGIAMLAATFVSVGPGLAITRGDLAFGLSRGRTSGIGGRGGKLESGMVVGQVALVLLMVSGAALLVRSVANLRAIDPGLDPESVAVIDALPPVLDDPAMQAPLVRDLVAAVAAVPGVESAAATQWLPLRGSAHNWGIEVQGRPGSGGTTFFRVVTPGYFRTMGIEVRSGRALRETDAVAQEEGVVVINQALADVYFPGEDPLGRLIGFNGERWDRIVGVVENVAEGELTPEAAPARYYLFDHVPVPFSGYAVVMRTAGDPAAVLDPARRAIQQSSPGVAIREVTTMRNVFDRSLGPALQVMSLLALLGTLAMLLGIVGVYGAVSHYVTRRKRDWGIKLSLGMAPARVIRQIVVRGGSLVGLGIVIGLVAFLVIARLLTSFLYGVESSDPSSLVAAVGLLLTAGLLAALVPALRASRIDPAGVLREQ